MNAVGIDVSKGKSMVAIIRPLGEIVAAPFGIKHSASDIKSLVNLIHSVEGESRIVMEHTGRYYEVWHINFPRPTFSSAPSTQNLSRTLTMTPFVRSNLTKRMPLRLHAMHLTNGKI